MDKNQKAGNITENDKKAEFEPLKAEIIIFEIDDVTVTSGGFGDDDPIILPKIEF